MRRRLALAAALVHDPELLVADEPTANLDPILRARLWQHFRARCAQGRTLFVTTQYIDEAEYCDRVGLMYDGMLIAVGRPEELRRRAFGGDIIESSSRARRCCISRSSTTWPACAWPISRLRGRCG
jgi:ABC-2 type transport system ATP-binding protein